MSETNKDSELQREERKIIEWREKNQRACRRLHCNGSWALNLVHNFSDGLPRGLCPLCHLWIHPRHEESGGPNQIIVVAEHPLYQVVRCMEHLDFTYAKLEQEYIKTVDRILSSEDTSQLPSIEHAYQISRVKAFQEFEELTQKYKPNSEVQYG